MGELDKETRAISDVVGVLGSLESAERERVIRYVAERFQIQLGGASRTRTAARESSEHTNEGPALGNIGNADYPDFASLVDACDPKTDSQRALVAAFWLEICQGGTNFDSQAANTELKHLGHRVANITRALDPLIKQKPSLVLQIRKSGNTRQARKLYKITEAGVRRIRAMIAGTGEDQ